jgi:hypothetical protein
MNRTTVIEIVLATDCGSAGPPMVRAARVAGTGRGGTPAAYRTTTAPEVVLSLSRSARFFAVLLAGVLSGCSVSYVIDAHVLERARHESNAGASRVAVAAERVDGGPVYVRYDALDLANAQPIDSGRVIARAPYRRGYRIGGPILIVLGAAALVAAIAITSWDLSAPCSAHTECGTGLAAGIVGVPLAVGGLGLLIPGAVLTAQGYRSPSEVIPAERGPVYLPR